MQNLRDKLLKAGAVDKKSKKKADHKARQDRTRKKRKGQRLDSLRQEKDRQYEEQRESKRKQDRERARVEQAEQERKLAAQQEQSNQQAAADKEEQLRLVRIYKVRELVQASLFLPKQPGPVGFHYVSRSGAIRVLEVSTRIAHELESGQLAIAQLPGRDRLGLINRDVTLQVLEVEPTLIRFFAAEGEDLAPDPSGLASDRPEPSPLRNRFSSSAGSDGGGRRDR